MGNYLIAPLGNYLTPEGLRLGNYLIVDIRNEKSHTADGNISDPIRAYEYLRLSSLAMHILERAQSRP